MKAPERIETERLVLRRPRGADAAAIFGRYACAEEVTRYLAWPRHRSVAETEAYLAHCDEEWRRWPAGGYLIEEDGALVGGTGLHFEAEHCASTGYVLARDAWGRGIATEALRAMVEVADTMQGLRRLHALCHAEHAASARVLEKAGFAREGTLRRHTLFPNLDGGRVCDVLCYARIFDG